MTETISKTYQKKGAGLLSKAKAVLKRQPEGQQDVLTAHQLTHTVEILNSKLKTQETLTKRNSLLLQRSQNELEKITQKYQLLYDLSPVGFINVSRKGIILNCNLKTANLFGWSKEQVIGKPLSNFVHNSSMPAYYDFFTNTKFTNTSCVCELKFARQRGLPFDALMEVHCQRDNSGAITDLLIHISDITESKEFEHALIAEMDRAQVTLHSIGDGVITTDADGFIDYMNPIAESLTGWSTQMAIGNNLQNVFHVVDENTKQPFTNLVQNCFDVNNIITVNEECVLISNSGKKFTIQYSIAPLKHRNGNMLGAVLVFSNITEARNMAQQIIHQATHDSLTGLCNRSEFEKRLHNAIKSARENRAIHCLCYLDLDQFKIINDTAGHAAGDELLRNLTIYLKSKIRSRDTLARHGGDEFCLLLDNCKLDQAYRIANSLLDAIKSFNFEWQGRTYSVSASIGLVPITSNTLNTAEVMSQADVACYTAKDLGRNRVYIYENDDNKMAARHSEILRVADLTDSIKANRFRIYCQSITPLQPESHESIHYELLIRAIDLDGKIELPKTFIPAAERYGMMATIDRWVIRSAFERYMELFNSSEKVKIAINLSGNSLADSTLLQYIRENISSSGIPANNVCFEITETAAINNLEQARKIITELKYLGCQFALDDFGSGVSSFTYLKNLPVDYLKIDGSFVMDMINDPINIAMVAAINEIGHVMGIKTIAECAESKEIIEQLTRLGVDYAQGYAISTPMPIDVVASKLNKFKLVTA